MNAQKYAYMRCKFRPGYTRRPSPSNIKDRVPFVCCFIR